MQTLYTQGTGYTEDAENDALTAIRHKTADITGLSLESVHQGMLACGEKGITKQTATSFTFSIIQCS